MSTSTSSQAIHVSGPATPAGRAVSARSALADPEGATTHGLFARDVVLPTPGEAPAAYEALLRQLTAELPPHDLPERHSLEQIAAASWRLRRLHRWRSSAPRGSQAQVHEGPSIGEDARLGRLDKTLRHETALTRQSIRSNGRRTYRAVRTLNRDLKRLFEGRARDEAFYRRDLTPSELRAGPGLGIEVQREAWRRPRPSPAPDLGGVSLDNTSTAQDCENEPPRSHPVPSDSPRIGGRGASDSLGCPHAPGQPQQSLLPSCPPLLSEGEGPRVRSQGPGMRSAEADDKKCENEPRPSQGGGHPAPGPGPVSLDPREAFFPAVGREGASVTQGEGGRRHEFCENERRDEEAARPKGRIGA